MTLHSTRRSAALALLVLTLGACASLPSTEGGSAGNQSYRIYDVGSGRFVAISDIAAATARADVLFFGEFHDSEGAHEAQRDLMRLIAAGDRDAVLGFEMFERDVQPIINHYLQGVIDEPAFMASSRPWPNYTTDYRPLLEVARAEGWPVLGTNLPQALATRVGREGLRALEDVAAEERRWAPAAVTCPLDDYYGKFVEAITGEDADTAAHATADAMLQNIFQAQCARDAAMAETIAPFIGGESLLIHINGSFHTDYYLGLTSRVAEAHPDAEVMLIATVGAENPARPDLEEHLEKGDFLIIVQEDPDDDQ